MAQMGGAVSHCFLGDILKNTGCQGSTLSGPRMTMGFGPFELPTRGLLLCSYYGSASVPKWAKKQSQSI